MTNPEFLNHMREEAAEVNRETDVELAKAGAAPVEAARGADTDEFFGEGEGQVAIDVYQTPEAIIIEAPIAGVSTDDLDISISNESVTIKGKRNRNRETKDEHYFYQECYWGRFSRSVILPQEIDPERSEAHVKNGVLVITLPKSTRAKAKKLKVKTDN